MEQPRKLVLDEHGVFERVPLVSAAATASSPTWKGTSPSHLETSGVVWLTRSFNRASFFLFEERPLQASLSSLNVRFSGRGGSVGVGAATPPTWAVAVMAAAGIQGAGGTSEDVSGTG